MEKTSKNKPNLVTWGANIRKIFYVNVNPIQSEDGSWSWDQIELSPGTLEYDEIVSSLIRVKYSDDQMTAIINNYLADPEDEEHNSEFQIMQEWRNVSKAAAKEAIQYAVDNGLWDNE